MSVAFMYTLVFLLVFPRLAGWEPLGILGVLVGALLACIVIGIAQAYESEKSQDKEILGTYVTEARYYEPWTEKIEHKDEETGEVTYETVEHEEDWEATLAEGDIIPIDEKDYQHYVRLFGNEDEEEADHYGEAEGEIIDPGYSTYTTWPGTFATASYEYVSRSYKNPTLGTANVYESEAFGPEAVKAYHLETYGRKGLYGTVKGEDAERLENEIRDYNCWFREKNIKLNFILLENVKSTHGMYWQQHWQNGKRNTINVVVGVNSEHKIEWAHVFGWQNEAACIKLRNFITGLDTIGDIASHFSQVTEILKENYTLPDFGEYNYVLGQFPIKGTLIALTICLWLYCGLFCRPPQYDDRAQEYLRKGQYELAKSNFQEYLDRVPDSAYALNNLGVLYYRENDYKTAEDLLSSSLENSYGLRSETKSIIYRNRGICYQELKQYKKAIADMKKAIEYEKYNTEHYCALYTLYKMLGYQKSIWSLQEQYNEYISDRLKNVCRDYNTQMTYVYVPENTVKGRGFMRLIERVLGE